MKNFNKFLNIFNILHSIGYLAIFIFAQFFDIFIIYGSFQTGLLVFSGIVALFNIIISIINFIKKNTKNGILSLLIGILLILILFRNPYIIFYVIISVASLILSIINLIFNKKLDDNSKSKISIILFAILVIVNIFMIATPITMFIIDLNNLENSLSKLEEEKNLETFIYKKDNNYVFLDSSGNEITTKDYDELLINGFVFSFKYNNHVAKLGVAKKDNEILFINSQGDEIFKLCNLFDDYSTVATSFSNYIVQLNKFGIEYSSGQLLGDAYIRNENFLQRYEETNTSFEDNSNYEYMYFKNENITNKVLQVAIRTNEIENDTRLSVYYDDPSFNSSFDRDSDTIKNFYEHEKEFYLLDMNEGTKTKLECSNLPYEAYYDENGNLYEHILLYSNGYIPFYDTNESGYFEENGEKVSIDTSYIIEDVNDKYIIILNKETSVTYFVSIQTGQIEQQIEDPVLIYKDFYIKCPNELNEPYQILDKDLNTITSSEDQPELVGSNFIFADFSIYYYNNDNITLIDNIESYDFTDINSPSNEIRKNGDTVYNSIGVLTYE